MAAFADRLLTWHARHGRHDLPWQHPRTPYRVWLSEVMLQQTQVATVIDYFERFVATFPNLESLAAAHEDAVLKLWAGLGYYSRARNLHRAARLCMEKHAGQLPDQFEPLLALPGIGRSTAGAILAQSHGLPYPILDGNAKRVLARFHAIAGWPGKAEVARELWRLAEARLPAQQIADYTQAIMDLGATVCTSRNPGCEHCPLSDDCRGAASGDPQQFPGRKARAVRPLRHAWLLLCVSDSGHLLLERRPPAGIWGGLWCPPVSELQPAEVLAQAPVIEHGFTHYRLNLSPVKVLQQDRIADGTTRWCNEQDVRELGLPRPIQVFLDAYFEGAVAWHEPSTV